MRMPRYFKRLVKSLFAVLGLSLSLLGYWIFSLDRELKNRVEAEWFLPPVEIYSAPSQIRVGQNLSVSELVLQLSSMGLRQRDPDLRLFAGDFSLWDPSQCQIHLNEKLDEDVMSCVTFILNEKLSSTTNIKLHPLMLVAFDESGKVKAVYEGEPLEAKEKIELNPHLFAQFYGGKPIIRSLVQVGEVPLFCLQAVTAIEDSDFLQHRGVSPTGLFRALVKNLSQGRYAQGGSTITQQLVKVYFLTSEKTLKRKLIELLMAILLEARIEKDKILSHYLNAIYMGQNGPFQVVGFGAASQHYFDKPIGSLNLPECALLAAIVNSPGRYNPFSSPERARQRRQKVLSRMEELKMIGSNQARLAQQSPLPHRPLHSLTEPAPYFVQAVEKEIEELNIDPSKGLKVFTTLDERAQENAQQSVIEYLKDFEARIPQLIQLKSQGKELQASLISLDIENGNIRALVGGRSFKKTQFNRALEGHRQVGSIMKPFVYLTALETRTPEGNNFNPLTPVSDEPFTYEYQGQSWSPVNYDKKFLGTIPLFTALKNSINSATAKLGLELGLEGVIDVARRAGIQSTISPLPSLTLGAFELYPMEVAQSYLTLARFGNFIPLSKILRIENLDGQILFHTKKESEQRFAPENVAVLIGMMKQTVLAGTARSLAVLGFNSPAAGKTGTTSDSKDSWFAGFTPRLLTVIWVGYNDNSSSKLTGDSGALPIWAKKKKKETSRIPTQDFSWPE
ncbi:MAG: transglycosylase domain-containing protein, partial [Bdellovibrionales bacterium]|nr:transglycosylase domain-containing protein [Bdellovibrionales bacterium]